MRPVIKKKKIDPRYFLNETASRDKLEEQAEEKPEKGDEWKPDPKDQPPEEKPDPKDQPEEELPDCPDGEAYDKDENKCKPKSNEGEKKKRKDRKVRRKEENGRDLLLGDKSLYEKIQHAIEEVFNELEENR